MYYSGDVGRWLVDGNIEFFGRSDDQVKIRGYRIELGEIEAKLLKHETVREAAVITRKDTMSDGMQLYAYMVSERELSTAGDKGIFGG